MKVKIIFLSVLLSILFLGLSEFATAQSSGGGGGSGVKILHIDDTFKVGWTEGTDNYEAEYKVWKIEETTNENITILTLTSSGGIAIHSLNGLVHSLGASAKLIINQIYVSGDDKWISITLENAEFKESTTPTTPPSSGGGGGGTTNNTGGGGQGGGCYDTDGGKDYYKKGIAAGVYDSCISKYQLSERYCINSQGADYIQECPIGYLCNDGACVQSDEDDRQRTNETSSSGGGGGGSGGVNATTSQCEKYYNCSDGSQVQYCFIHKFYNENGEVVGAGCGCKSGPQSLCTAPSSGGGGGSGGQPILINSSSGGGGGGGGVGTNETPIICNGCILILGNKCAPVGYRHEGKYCTLNSEFVPQLSADNSCENNFECSTNLCIDNKCISSGLWQKFIRWLSRIFR